MKLQFALPDWSLRPLPHSAPPNRGGCCLQPLWTSRLSSNRPMNLPGMCLPPDCMLTAVCKHKLSDRMLQRGRCEPCSSVDWTRSMQQCVCCQIMQGLGQACARLLSVTYQTQAVRWKHTDICMMLVAQALQICCAKSFSNLIRHVHSTKKGVLPEAAYPTSKGMRCPKT